MADSGSDGVGYRSPPKSTQFKRGQSGNPNGRPRGRRREVPYDNVLGQMVTIREEGRERRVTAAEAFLLHLTKRGLEGDSAAARASLAALETARGARGRNEPMIGGIITHYVRARPLVPVSCISLGTCVARLNWMLLAQAGVAGDNIRATNAHNWECLVTTRPPARNDGH